jgi:hypothetical protein
VEGRGLWTDPGGGLTRSGELRSGVVDGRTGERDTARRYGMTGRLVPLNAIWYKQGGRMEIYV